MRMPGFEQFRAQYGATRIAGPPVADAFIDTYRDRLPNALLEEWRISGLAGFDDGFIWLANPDDMAPSVAEWNLDPNALVFARTGFGDLFFWDGRGVHC